MRCLKKKNKELTDFEKKFGKSDERLIMQELYHNSLQLKRHVDNLEYRNEILEYQIKEVQRKLCHQ